MNEHVALSTASHIFRYTVGMAPPYDTVGAGAPWDRFEQAYVYAKIVDTFDAEYTEQKNRRSRNAGLRSHPDEFSRSFRIYMLISADCHPYSTDHCNYIAATLS